MRTSEDRVLTTHTGSLPRSRDLLELYDRSAAADEIDRALTDAVKAVVQQQLDTGIDIVNDGEFGKPVRRTGDSDHGHGAWITYVEERVSGFSTVQLDPSDLKRSKDRTRFTTFYGRPEAPSASRACTGEIRFHGHEIVARDTSNLAASLNGKDPGDAFLPAISPSSVIHSFPNAYYDDEDEYRSAIADAMREEYLAIIDAGFQLQIDDPIVVAAWDAWRDDDLESYRRAAARDIELLNHALRGIPAEKIRYHLCWGSWHGPHTTDLPLADVADLILQANVSGYVVEAANPRHEHEWKVWQEVTLPDDKLLIPGVVTHKTPVVEHPEVVADRIVRYADVVGRERVIAGTDCGVGGRVSSDIAWAKLAVLVEGARLASDRLWG